MFRDRAIVRSRRVWLASSSLVALVYLGLAGDASADPITYEFVGADLQSAGCSANIPFPCPDLEPDFSRITVSITFSMALIDIPELNTGANMAGSVLEFTMSDGATTVTHSTPGYDLSVSISGTDPDALARGEFAKWSVGVSQQQFPGLGNLAMSTFFDPGFSIVDKSSYCVALRQDDPTQCNTLFNARVTNGVGVWTAVVDDGGGGPMPVPEPGTLVLFGAGLIGLTLARRRLRRQNPTRSISQYPRCRFTSDRSASPAT